LAREQGGQRLRQVKITRPSSWMAVGSIRDFGNHKSLPLVPLRVSLLLLLLLLYASFLLNIANRSQA